MNSSNLETNRFEGRSAVQAGGPQLLFVLHRRAAPLLFSGVNALNFTTKTWVTILLVASYDLLRVIRALCRSRM
jgi:hypothetical protein